MSEIFIVRQAEWNNSGYACLPACLHARGVRTGFCLAPAECNLLEVLQRGNL